MDKKEITSVVSEVISEATRAKGWSLAKLTRYLGKGSNTLHRWKSGQTTAYDMEALIELFQMADMSMDEAFGLSSTAGESRDLPSSFYETLCNDIDRIESELAYLRPLARLATAISAIVTALDTTTTDSEAALLTKPR